MRDPILFSFHWYSKNEASTIRWSWAASDRSGSRLDYCAQNLLVNLLFTWQTVRANDMNVGDVGGITLHGSDILLDELSNEGGLFIATSSTVYAFGLTRNPCRA